MSGERTDANNEPVPAPPTSSVVTCPQCKTRLKAPEITRCIKLRCPKCNSVLMCDPFSATPRVLTQQPVRPDVPAEPVASNPAAPAKESLPVEPSSSPMEGTGGVAQTTDGVSGQPGTTTGAGILGLSHVRLTLAVVGIAVGVCGLVKGDIEIAALAFFLVVQPQWFIYMGALAVGIILPAVACIQLGETIGAPVLLRWCVGVPAVICCTLIALGLGNMLSIFLGLDEAPDQPVGSPTLSGAADHPAQAESPDRSVSAERPGAACRPRDLSLQPTGTCTSCPNCDEGAGYDLRRRVYASFGGGWDSISDAQWWLYIVGIVLSLGLVPHVARSTGDRGARLMLGLWVVAVLLCLVAEILLSVAVRFAPTRCGSCSTWWGPGDRGLAAILLRRLAVAQSLFFAGDRQTAIQQVERVVELGRRHDLAGTTEVWPAALTLRALYCLIGKTKEGQQQAHAALSEALRYARLPATISTITAGLASIEGRVQPREAATDWRALSQRVVEGVVVPPDPPIVGTGWAVGASLIGGVAMLWFFGAFGAQKQAPVTWFYYEVTETIWYRRR